MGVVGSDSPWVSPSRYSQTTYFFPIKALCVCLEGLIWGLGKLCRANLRGLKWAQEASCMFSLGNLVHYMGSEIAFGD